MLGVSIPETLKAKKGHNPQQGQNMNRSIT